MLQPRVAARAPNKIVSDGGVAKSSPAAKARARARGTKQANRAGLTMSIVQA
jgi:hypothetical protein